MTSSNDNNDNNSDAAYQSFLNKANADVQVGLNANVNTTTAGAGKGTKTVDAGVIVPPTLASVRQYYMSDADEPFLPVVLAREGAKDGVWPDAGITPLFYMSVPICTNDIIYIEQFASIISLSAVTSRTDVSVISPESFDPKGRYKSVIDAVKETLAEDAEVKVYRVGVSHSKLEYWVLGLDQPNKRILGLRAKAVES